MYFKLNSNYSIYYTSMDDLQWKGQKGVRTVPVLDYPF